MQANKHSMNTAIANYKRQHYVREATINKLCVALTELTTKVSDQPNKDLRKTFVTYCKRYKINNNLWHSLKGLGYLTKEKDGWRLKVNRHEINKNMARTIIEDYNVKTRNLKLTAVNPVTEESNLTEEIAPVTSKLPVKKKVKDVYVLLDKMAFDTSTKFYSIDEIKEMNIPKSSVIVKLVGDIEVVVTKKFNLL